jgi:hypothetical protein
MRSTVQAASRDFNQNALTLASSSMMDSASPNTQTLATVDFSIHDTEKREVLRAITTSNFEAMKPLAILHSNGKMLSTLGILVALAACVATRSNLFTQTRQVCATGQFSPCSEIVETVQILPPTTIGAMATFTTNFATPSSGDYSITFEQPAVTIQARLPARTITLAEQKAVLIVPASVTSFVNTAWTSVITETYPAGTNVDISLDLTTSFVFTIDPWTVPTD